MALRTAASVLLTLVYCAAETNVPRWSKPAGDLGQGEWVPLNNDRWNEDKSRIPSAIEPHLFNRALHENPSSPRQFAGEPQAKEAVGAQSAPPNVAYIHPQTINSQVGLQQPQIPPQQLLSHYLHQVGQANIASRALLHKQPLLNSNYYPQQEGFNLEPNYNQVQNFKNPPYSLNSNTEFENSYLEEDKQSGNPAQGSIKSLQESFASENFRENVSSIPNNKKEEVQILYVPVEMLKQQERARNAQNNIPVPQGFPLRHPQLDQVNQQFEPKETKKFRHPIQPLKDQVPAYHLRGALTQEKLLYPSAVTEDEREDSKTPFQKQSFTNPRSSIPPRNKYYPEYKSEGGRAVPSTNKEQYVEESTIQDEISDFRNTVTRRTPQKDVRDRAPSTLPPPNQPPLSVFMESTTNNRVGDVLSLLKDSKTIPVLDSVGSDAPQVFVGPSNLHTPLGYIKYELPYLSSFHNNNAPHKLAQVPFFVAPLNFQPPPGFAKIPFPPPHIGSVVLSNVTNHQTNDDVNVPTQSSVERHTVNYKETFTIPADISSISPQLPSLINSLQEDEYLGSSSTESLSEPTEEPTVKHRRPTTSRRQNNRGSQRAYSSSVTTTRRPSSRQKQPSTRYFNQRNNQNSESKANPTINDESYSDATQFDYNSNTRPEALTSPKKLVDKNHDYPITESHGSRDHSSSGVENNKQDQRSFEQTQRQFNNDFNQEPYSSQSYSSDEVVNLKDGVSGSPIFNQGRIHNVEQPNLFQDSRTSEPLTHATNTQSSHFQSNVPQLSNTNYQNQQIQSVRTQNSFDQQTYQGIRPLTNLPSQVAGVESNAGSLPTYEELPYRKQQLNGGRDEPQEIKNHQLNYRFQDQTEGIDASVENPSLLKTFQDQTRFQNDNRHTQQPLIDVTTDKQQAQGYLENFDGHNSSFISNEQYNTPDNYGGNAATVRLTQQTSNYPQTTSRTIDYNDQTTERPVPIRGRTRVRGRIHSTTAKTTPAHRFQGENENQQHEHPNRNSQTISKLRSDNYDERSQYQTESNHYTTTDQTPVSPNRKYLHSRGRRPLRPTVSTTASPTTTTPPPGTKYLIRTRRPSATQTKLQTGRGRIRRPTTPTTTTQASTTTEYPRTVPYQWRQPTNDDDYSAKENISPTQESLEYKSSPQYQDGRTSVNRFRNPQDDREEAYHQRRTHQRPKVDQLQKTPNYPYESDDSNVSTQKVYDATDVPQYSSSFERTLKPHASREYEPSLQPNYPRDYGKTSSPHSSREYEPTQKTFVPNDYEETQKPHYVREYEATLKPHFSREYETTQKPQFSKDYDNAGRTQTYDKYEPSQNAQNNRNFEPALNSEQYHDFKTPTVKDYASTNKPQTYRNHEATLSQNIQEYETTHKPYLNQGETSKKTHSANLNRANSHRKRPSYVNRGEDTKYNSPESSTTKNTDADFWNQAVTIQQSQSYVYNPDDDQPQIEGSSSSKVNSKSGALQNDYDDYYNVQDGAQYSSDQSPFPSNDQHVTYEKANPNQEIGKANQYPEKSTFDKNVSEEEKEHEPQHEHRVPYETSDLQLENFGEGSYVNSSKDLGNQSPKKEVSNESVQKSAPAESLSSSSDSRKKSGKRRGTWVRVRVKKPKDVFETAESQRFSAVRQNSLIPGETNTKVLQEITVPESNSTAANVQDEPQPELFVETTVSPMGDTDPKQSSGEQYDRPEEDNSGHTTSKDLLNDPEAEEGITTSTIESVTRDQGEDTLTTITSQNTTPTPDSPEVYRTSTTTEISLETEICYKGKCVKTKRKKDKNERDFPLLT